MRSLRVYFVSHREGLLSGTLMRARESWLDPPSPAAIGRSEEEVLEQLERILVSVEAAAGEQDMGRFLWEERFQTRRADVEVQPHNVVGGHAVIGKMRIPLRLTFAWSETKNGSYRVMLPRFGWWFILEELEDARGVIARAVSASLLGERPTWIYEFRYEGEEYVREWQPSSLDRLRNWRRAEPTDEDNFPVLSTVGEDWVARAARRKLPLVVGEEPAMAETVRLVEREPPASILLLGSAGVGKTSLVRRLARYLLERGRGKHGARKHTRLWATSSDNIIAGMVYLGMWQRRCLQMIDELSHEGDYLYVDRLTDLMRAQPDGGTIADMFAPAMAAREVALIAECDEIGLQWCRQRSAGFVDNFHIVRVNEIDVAALTEMIESYQGKKNARVRLHPTGSKRLIGHLNAFRPDERFPGKAFRFLDWYNQTAEGTEVTLRASDVSAAFSRYTGLPLDLISDDVSSRADAIADRLQARIIGQDEACALSARVLARLKAGLNDPERPVGSLMFVGPTGVGKTELAKQLAAFMFGSSDRMVRVDMSEYMTPGSSQRLLAVGRGVTSLAEEVRQQPLTVVLLDEIEKAHPEVFDLLLGVLGEGRLTDTSGRLVDLRMALIVMTSNLGTGESAPVGFGERPTRDHAAAVRRHFKPELLGRIDHIVEFRSLGRDDIEKIVDLEILEASRRIGLRRREIDLRLTEGARCRLAELGYDPLMGARPLKRVIEERVVARLAARISEDPALRDCIVRVVPDGDDIGLEVRPS